MWIVLAAGMGVWDIDMLASQQEESRGQIY